MDFRLLFVAPHPVNQRNFCSEIAWLDDDTGRTPAGAAAKAMSLAEKACSV
jgi:hypothetical protein